MLLIDSSIYIDWLRRRIPLPRKLAPWIRSREVCACGVIVVEVVRGIVDARQKRLVKEFFDLLPAVSCDADIWRRTADLAWQLDRQGKVLPLTDLFIAVCALRMDAVVITTDPHFAEIPKLKHRATLPPHGG